MAEALERADPALDVELVPIRTSGDERKHAPVRAASAAGAPGDKSRFVKEIEEALLGGHIDLAVHSAKDVPGELPDGLSIVGVPERADPRDAVCGAESLAALAEGATVGTSSLRRRAQLLALRPDLRVEDLRGNVDTRLRKLREQEYDSIVLATAGLARLGVADGSAIDPAEMTPAPGQGCLALEARSGDERVADVAAAITDRRALLELTAERALVSGLEASCRTPVAAYAQLDGERVTVSAFAGLPDGSTWIRDRLAGHANDAGAVGAESATRLLAAGVRDILGAAEEAGRV